jgi:GPI mannosyltransferase 3
MSEAGPAALRHTAFRQIERAVATIASGHSGLLFVLLLALVARVTVILAFPGVYHPDENFQFLEQAHRLAFGYGIVPWELADGLRSLLLPSLFGRLFAGIALFGGGPYAYVLVTRMLLAAFSLVTVAVVYRSALRQSRTHALLAGVVAASWFEIVFFSSRPLTEAIASNFLLMGLALACRPRAEYSHAVCALIGFVLACCAMVRIQLAPATLLIALWVASGDFKRRSGSMLLGGLLPVVAFGVADYVTWGSSTIVNYVTANLLQEKANLFGTAPVYWYGKNLLQTWAGTLPLLAVLVVLGWRRSKLWVLVAGVIIGVHSLIPHKEYRFVYPAYACLIIAAALGSADLVETIRTRFGPERGRQALQAAVVLWIATSCSLALTSIFIHNWSAGTQLARSFFWLHDQPQACGVQLLDHRWDETGGYTHLHRNIPMYDGVTDPRTTGRWTAYNYIVLDREHTAQLPGQYQVQRCFGTGNGSDVCVAGRPGACATSPLPSLLQQKRLGEFAEYTRPLP